MSVMQIEMFSNHDLFHLPVMNNSPEPLKLEARKTLERIVNITELPRLPERILHAPITKTDINAGKDLHEEDVQDLLVVLNDFRDCVAVNIFELGRAKEAEFEIHEKPGAKPVYCKPYRASDKEREQIKKIVAEWREAGIVRDTNSPYASPVLLVTKKKW